MAQDRPEVPAALVEMVGKHMAARGLTVDRRDALLFTARDAGCSATPTACGGSGTRRPSPPGSGELVEDEATGRHRYVGLRRANATGLVAEGVDIKSAQAMLGHSIVQLTVGLYAQAVVSLGSAAAESMATRFHLPGLVGKALADPGSTRGGTEEEASSAAPAGHDLS